MKRWVVIAIVLAIGAMWIYSRKDDLPRAKDKMIEMGNNLITRMKDFNPVDPPKYRTEPMAFRKAVPVISRPAVKQGELRVAVAKLSQVPDNRPLISTGIPFARGQIDSENDFAFFDLQGHEIPIAVKVLAHWPQDQTIRSVLVQFYYPIEHTYEYVMFKWGFKRTSKDLEILPPTEDYPQGYIVMPAQWLCDSHVIGEQVPVGLPEFKEYDDKILQNVDTIINTPWTGNFDHDGYYSTPHVFYQFYVRSGELKYFLAARKELLHYRDTQIIKEGKDKGKSWLGDKPQAIYVEALADDYLLTGDPVSWTVAGYMADYLRNYIKASRFFYPKDSHKFWTERLVAFPFLGVLTYYELTQQKEYLELATRYMENLYKTQMQWPSRGGFIHNMYAHDPDEGASRNEFGGSPFMTGLLMESVIKFHQLTGSEIAADSIFRVADWLINEGATANRDGFKYLTINKYIDSVGEPDLNFMIIHALGYAYRLSGYKNLDYLDLGQKALDRGVREAYIEKRKHFNQNYRNSGYYLAYIYEGLKNQVQKTREEKIAKETLVKKDIFYFEGFEFSLGRFKGENDVTLIIDKEKPYLKGNSLKIVSRFTGSSMTLGVDLDQWHLDGHPFLNYAYLIPPGVPVGMRVKTRFGDWVCIGGTSTYTCDDNASKIDNQLVDDDQWHEIHVDVKESVQSLLPKVTELSAFQFYTGANARQNDQFWIDEFKIKK